jgi:hypothetical protein
MSLSILMGLLLGISLAAGIILMILDRWLNLSAKSNWLDPSTIFSAIVLTAVVIGLLVPHS